jgi:hypothetical protein
MSQAPREVLPLNYRTVGGGRGRPGSIVAIGILSLLVGLLSAAMNGALGIWWGWAYARSVPPPPEPGEAPPIEARTPFQGDYVGQRGLGKAERLNVIDAMRKTVAFTPDRQAMLDRLLADAGRDIFGDAGGDLARAIVAKGRATAGPDGTGALASHYFTIRGGGRAEVNNTSATFTGGVGMPVIRVDFNVFGTHTSQPRWSAVAISQALADTRVRLNGRLTELQAAAIIDQLPAPVFPPPRDNRMPHFQAVPIDIVSQSDDDGVLLAAGSARTWIYPNGRIADSNKWPDGVNPETGQPNPRRPSARLVPGNTDAMRALSATAAIGTLLAIWLIVAAIRLLIDSPGAARMHARFAALKLTQVATELAISVGFLHSVHLLGGDVRATGVTLGYNIAKGARGVAISTLVSMVYPVVLVVWLQSRTTRNYAVSTGQELSLLSSDFRASLGRRACAFFAGGVGRTLLLLVTGGCAVALIANFAAVLLTPNAATESWYVTLFCHALAACFIIPVGFVCVGQLRRGVVSAAGAAAARPPAPDRRKVA